jgi:hypothetical protein
MVTRKHKKIKWAWSNLVALRQPKTNSIVASYLTWSFLDGFQNKKWNQIVMIKCSQSYIAHIKSSGPLLSSPIALWGSFEKKTKWPWSNPSHPHLIQLGRFGWLFELSFWIATIESNWPWTTQIRSSSPNLSSPLLSNGHSKMKLWWP